MTKNTCYFFVLIILFLTSHSTSRAEPNKLNIVFILIDDFGWYDVGYNGSTFYETPHMDQFARDWMRFDNCYTPSPMCSPTRVSIMTGKNPARHGVTQWLPGRDTFYGRPGEKPAVYCPKPKSARIKGAEITLGETFQAAGYETAFYGKWHMGPLKSTGGPKAHGFDHELAVIETNGCSMFFPFRQGRKPRKPYFPDAKRGDNFTDKLTEHAIKFVSRPREKPFFLYLSHFAMHSPIDSKPELARHFEKKRDQLPVISKRYQQDEFAHQAYRLRQDEPEYAGELATLDANIGKLIASLKTRNLYDNTIVILTGDNGGRTGDFKSSPTSVSPLRGGKTFLYEGGLRTPLLIHWPGHRPEANQSSAAVTSMDFYPTLLAMTGLEPMPKQHLDGENLVPLFKGGTLKRNTMYWHFPHYQGEGSYPASCIRVGDYKLIKHYHHQKVQLFDLANDPNETQDLSKRMPEKTEAMKKQLEAYLAETGAVIPQPKSTTSSF